MVLAAERDRELLGEPDGRRARGLAPARPARRDRDRLIPSALAYGQVGQTFSEDGTPAPEQAERLEKGFGRFAEELEWYARALRAARASGVPRR